MRILIAEDDGPLASFIAKTFASEGHESEIAPNGELALERLTAESFDLLILDLGLPIVSGSEVLAKVRSHDEDLPILVLTAAGQVSERVACLDAGADDYLTKPFSFSELSARVRALARRQARGAVTTLLKVDDLELDCVQRTVRRNGVEVELTPERIQPAGVFHAQHGPAHHPEHDYRKRLEAGAQHYNQCG